MCRSSASLTDGSEMLFGVPSPRSNGLDLQIAQWRLCTNAPTNDPNAFTIDGSMPPPSPRKDPRRRMTADIVAQARPGDELSRQAIQHDLKRAETNAGDAPQPSPRERDRRASGEGGSQWRKGDTLQLSLDGGVNASPHAPGNPSLDSRWRKGDSFQFAFDGSGQAKRAPNPYRNPTWRIEGGWKD